MNNSSGQSPIIILSYGNKDNDQAEEKEALKYFNKLKEKIDGVTFYTHNRSVF